jgi:hypothetical protein
MKPKPSGYKKQFEPDVYEYFLNELTEEKYEKICNIVNKFVGSEDFQLNLDRID